MENQQKINTLNNLCEVLNRYQNEKQKWFNDSEIRLAGDVISHFASNNTELALYISRSCLPYIPEDYRGKHFWDYYGCSLFANKRCMDAYYVWDIGAKEIKVTDIEKQKEKENEKEKE